MSENLIGQIITAVSTLLLALIGYLKLKAGQEKIDQKVDVYHKEVNGMKGELVEAVKGRSNAEGQLSQIEKVKQEGVVAAAVVVPLPPEVQKVEIVEQAKPIDVKIKKEDKL